MAGSAERAKWFQHETHRASRFRVQDLGLRVWGFWVLKGLGFHGLGG